MLSVTDALAMVLAQATPLALENLPLQNALRRILAIDLQTPHDSPPFDKSLMDGFAVTTLSNSNPVLKSNPEFISLKVVETVTAGMTPSNPVTAVTAVRIMTGAALPAGCDCVVPIERTQFDAATPNIVSIPRAAFSPESCLMRQGGAAKKGEQLITAGTRLQPQQIAALAEFGEASVPVFRRPTVAVLATGDELIPFDEPLRPGAIRNSNEIGRAHV